MSDLEQVSRVFFPYMTAVRDLVIQRKWPFVHYCSAETLVSILARREVWMRKASLMNDFREMEYGSDLIERSLHSSAGNSLKMAVDRVHNGLFDDVIARLPDETAHHKENTFLTCLSIHKPQTENTSGRLSMWRAYGGNNGVAVVLNPEPFIRQSDYLGAYSAPVLYAHRSQFNGRVSELAESINSSRKIIDNINRDEFRLWLLAIFRFAVLSTKHPGFSEEQEWRIFYTRGRDHGNGLAESTKVVAGVPQTVVCIPLKNVPEHDLTDLEPAQLIKRVIVGPTAYRNEIREALVSVMGDAGVLDADKKVFLSGIPLRR